ncbi:MAG TPA: isochorismate synthase [Actinomycetota bacterium]|nr:isochorismate synthase [Actinomycetota bacterium]
MTRRLRPLVARTRIVEDALDPLTYVHPNALVWAEGERALIGWGQTLEIAPDAGDVRFSRTASQLEDFFGSLEIDDEVGSWGTGPLAFGSFAFDPDSSNSRVVVPSSVVGRDGQRTWVTVIGEEGAPLPRSTPSPSHPSRGIRRRTRDEDAQQWELSVARACQAIRDGLVTKVVLAREICVEAATSFDPGRVVRRLAGRYPECFVFSFDGWVGASPELLVRRRGLHVESTVLAGTAMRGSTEHDDDAARSVLLASRKDRHEHELAVASVRDALAPMAADLTVDGSPGVLRLNNVQHLATDVHARLASPTSVLDLVARLHPSAAVCGVPTDKALALIRELEGLDRGRYSGPIGWTDARGDGEWAIALRCAELDGRRARLFAGNGIVSDSDPQAELAETELKLKPMLSALGEEVTE